GSHPEHPEPRRRDRGVEGRREGERQHPPRLPRRDDAVVPQAGGGGIGIAFLFLSGADPLLEGLPFPRPPRPPARLAISAATPGPRGRQPPTEMRALGRVKRKRGPEARPHMP